MAFEVKPYPEFSWSNSRDRLLSECKRKYYWRYYGGWNGWLRETDAIARRAWTLSKLTTYPLALGSAIHERAKEIALSIKWGRQTPTLDELRTRVRNDLNGVHRGSKDRPGFLARPKDVPMLHPVYYGRRVSDRHLDKVRDRMEQCLTNLVESAVWDELREADPEQILVIDSREAFMFRGTKVYAVPDLLFRTNGRWVVVDWKTGSPSEDGEDEQLAVYALYLRDGLNNVLSEGDAVGRIVNVRDGTDRLIEITRQLLSSAEDRIQASSDRMRDFVVDRDPARNVPIEFDRFPMVEDTSRCKWCEFYELCEPHFANPQ